MLSFNSKNLLILGFLCLGLNLRSEALIRGVPENYNTISQAITASSNGDTVLVSPGTYNESLTFGGKRITVGSRFLLDGDVEWIERTIIDASDQGRAVSFTDNEEHSSRLSGFTLRNGNVLQGGGIFCNSASPILDHLIIENNTAQQEGGGIALIQGSSPLLEDLTVRGNHAAEQGGGLFIYDACNPVLTRVKIIDNTGSSGGGAFWGLNCSVRFTACDIINNTASSAFGGGLALSSRCSLIMIQTTILGNQSGSSGGGIYVGASSITGHQVTIAYNESPQGGGIYLAGVMNSTLLNSIFWQNDSSQIYFRGNPNPVPTLAVRYSDVENGREGITVIGNLVVTYEPGNIAADPEFQDPETQDVHLTADSPCIDAGDPDAPRDPDSTRADMGAYPFDHRVNVPGFVSPPSNYSLNLQVYPNPFNSQTQIFFNLESRARMCYQIYDLGGRIWMVSPQMFLERGPNQFILNADNLPTGRYWLILDAGGARSVCGLSLIR